MKTTIQLQRDYPKCFRPLQPKVKKIVGFKKRHPFKEWYNNLCKN